MPRNGPDGAGAPLPAPLWQQRRSAHLKNLTCALDGDGETHAQRSQVLRHDPQQIAIEFGQRLWQLLLAPSEYGTDIIVQVLGD